MPIPTQTLMGAGHTPWHHPSGSPSSLSSGGSISPTAVDPSPSKSDSAGNSSFNSNNYFLKIECHIS